MARTDYYGIKTTDLTATSSAIRAVNNTSDLIAPENYAELISTMKSGADYQNALNQMVEESATGSIASFTDGANQIPCKQVICHINPTETGTGEKSPSNPYVIGGHSEINVTQTGKNSFTIIGETNGYYVNSNGELSSSAAFCVSDYTRVKGDTTYTFTTNSSSGANPRHCFYDKDKIFISAITTANNQVTFTTPTNAVYMRFSYRTTSINVQLELGSTSTAYEPYITPVINTVPFGQTVYGGELILQEGQNDKINKAFEKVDLGSLKWTKYYGFFYAPLDIKKQQSSTTKGKIYCTSYETILYTQVYNNTAVGISDYLNQNRIAIYDSTYADYTAEQFKTAVSGIDAVYELATPEEITLQTKTVILTLLGANNIYHDCNGDIDVTYRANGALYVQEHPIT